MSNQTKKNLMEAFAGESQANRRYLAFARKAEEEGLSSLARLFRAVAESETVHALNHLKCVEGVHSSLENVEEAWKGEKAEYTDMYPMFMGQAESDADNEALKTFYWANETEKIHADFYEKAKEALKQGQDVQLGELHICSVCGNTVEGDLPDKCPICGADRDRFMKSD
jgi:rubrerythrin